MLRRSWGYLKTLLRVKAERAMDPAIEIEQAIGDARKSDQALRGQAAKVIAHRTKLEQKIEDSADSVGEAREAAKQALLKADAAARSGDAAAAGKWTSAAQSLAMKLQASEGNLESLKEQYGIAVAQSDEAKSAVQQNAMRLQELVAKRIELLGQLEQAKMQETVNEAVDSMSETLEVDSPSLERVEDKIQERLANAKANAELREASPEGAEAELREAVSLSKADDKLLELRKELGLDAPAITPELGSPTT